MAQVVQEGMDDTRVDLTQLENDGGGRSVPTTPLQISPATELLATVTFENLFDQFLDLLIRVANRFGTRCVLDTSQTDFNNFKVISMSNCFLNKQL